MPASLPRPVCLGLFALFSFFLCGLNTRVTAQSAPQAVGLGVGGDNLTRLLWNNPDGSVSLWRLNADASVTAYTYGPFAGWSAQSLAVGTDNVSHILWDRNDGYEVVWDVNNQGIQTNAATGVSYLYSGYTATAVAVGPNNAVRVMLWNPSSSSLSLWDLSRADPWASRLDYTTSSVWTPTALAVGADNAPSILWRHVSGSAYLWKVNSTGGYSGSGTDAYSGYTPVAMTVDGGNSPHLLWDHPSDNTISLWNIAASYSADLHASSTPSYYADPVGFTPKALASGSDGKLRLLWDGPSGSAQIWAINSDDSYTPIIYSAVASLNLTAAATGSNKVTLYWNGVTGVSGYNVYRGTASGGPYSLVAANVSTPNNGPGRAGSFMYTDANGLTTGTEYSYIVTAVQSGVETVQSNENSSTPDTSAIPWDTGDPAQIVAAVNATAANDLQPDVDTNGKVIPQQVGVLFIGGPDGVVYLGNVDDFTPPQAYAAPGHVIGNTLVSNDGTVVSFADSPSGDASLAPAIERPNDALGLWSDALLSPQVTVADTFPYQSTKPPTGIYRKVESAPGFNGLSAYIGLPRSQDANAVHLLHHLSTSTAASGNSDVGKDYPSTGDIYTGGAVYSPSGSEGSEVDAGLQLNPDPNSNMSAGWSPIVSNRRRLKFPNDNKLNPETADKIYLDGSAHALPVGNQQGALLYKMHMEGEIHMQFLTPKSASVRDQSVRLHFSPAPYFYGLGEPTGRIILEKHDPMTGRLISTGEVPYLTLEYFGVLGWHKAHSTFIIKRVNSIAQTLNSPQAPGAPQADAPSGSTVKGYFADGSFIRRTPADNYGLLNSGASWGLARPTDVALLSPTAGWQAWTDDAAVTSKAGSYPARSAPNPIGSGAISYNSYHLYSETDISLTMK